MELHPWITALLLGIIEGLTEFIPVSSTGHLLIAEHWLPKQSELFNIVIQSGAVLAVLPLFKHRLQTIKEWQKAHNQTLILQVLAAFLITCVGGFILHKCDFHLPEATLPVALALLVGGILFIGVEQLLKSQALTSSHSWLSAILIGLAQLVAAIFPGSSRSGTTILASMLTGTQRAAATEFSFLVGVPTILTASLYKAIKELKHGTNEDWIAVGIGALAAAIVSFITVRWLLRFVQSHTFVGFGVYRIIVGTLLIIHYFYSSSAS